MLLSSTKRAQLGVSGVSQVVSQCFGIKISLKWHFETAETGETGVFDFWIFFILRFLPKQTFSVFQANLKNAVSAVSAVSKCCSVLIFAQKR